MTDIGNRDYTLIIDKSGSMQTKDCAGKSRWDAAKEGAIALAHKCAELDADGITVYAFSNTWKRYDNVTPDKVTQVFSENEPFGGTDTAGVLEDAFKLWHGRKKSGDLKGGETIVVITDGEPNDEKAVEKSIINVSKHMDADEELAISFLQVGKDDGAQRFLEHLDDDLEGKGAKFDIVDTKTWKAMEEGGLTMTDVLIQAITD